MKAIGVVMLLALIATSGVQAGKVLVLGSDGLIGSHLLAYLQEQGLDTLQVQHRRHIDLREPGALDQFDDQNVSFVFFLACEVGGSKFINNAESNVQLEIIENNLAIYRTVFPWVQKHSIPYIFTSSYLQGQPTPYGTVKRLGERWVESLGFGKIVRFWNVYGPERVSMKSHVLTDWIVQCLETGTIACRTDGREARQFLHVLDAARGLHDMMIAYLDETEGTCRSARCDGKSHAQVRQEQAHTHNSSHIGVFVQTRDGSHHDREWGLDLVTDISTGMWTSLRTIATHVARIAYEERLNRMGEEGMMPGGLCEVTYTDKVAPARARVTPRNGLPFWTNYWDGGARISIQDGLRLMSVSLADRVFADQ